MSTYDLAVVGGGPGGLAAAMYAAMRGMSVVAFEAESFGGQLVNLYPSKPVTNFPAEAHVLSRDLAMRLAEQASSFGAELREWEPVEHARPGTDGFVLRSAGQETTAGASQDETVGARAGVFDRLPLAQLGAEARCLLGEPHREVTRQHVCLGGKVGHGLAGIQVDELSAEGLGLEGHDRHAAHRGVHRRRQTAGAAADDGEIVGCLLMLRSEGCSHLKASTISARLHTKLCEAVTPACAD